MAASQIAGRCDAGATTLMAVEEMFWGARYGKLLDPFGHEWALNQQKVQRSPEENQAATTAYLDATGREPGSGA